MHHQTIPAEQWIPFFEEFSCVHLGWSATIELADAAPRNLAESVAFQGISFDTKGTRPSSMQISAGDGSAHIAHTVDLPLNIRQVEDHGGNIHLQVEAAIGPLTVVHLRAPAH